MSKPRRLVILPLMFAATLAVSACESDDEKAAGYFESGQALLAQGDEVRALVEFRNVFKYDPFHFEARKIYADVLVKRGELPEAYSQYLRLVEQYPDTADVRQILAELAIANNDWEEAERHGQAAITLAPDVPGVTAIRLVLDYRAAALIKDDAARARIADGAKALLATLPDSTIARRIVIDHLVSGPEPIEALPVIDEALARDPQSLEYHMMKFLLLNQTGQVEPTGAQLQLMFNLFPDNQEVRSSLIAWYMARKDYDAAEKFLRTLAGELTGPVDFHLGLVQFIQTQRGEDAARAELQSLIAANGTGENAQMYQALVASLDYQAGKRDQAVAAIQAIVAAAEPSEQTRRIKGMLARMLDETGNRVGARALVEEVLAENRTNPAALKLRATWFITEDKTGPAIVDLNAALEAAPRDPEIFTLLALAQEREGSPERMGELLGKAVEASGAAPAESLRYARFLTDQGDLRQAEIVLTTAWNVSPGQPEILRFVTDLFIAQKKWPEAQNAVDMMANIDTPEIRRAIPGLQAAILDGQGRTAEAIAVLETEVAKGEGAPAAILAIVQSHLRQGNPDAARTYLDSRLALVPDDRDLRLLSAGLDAQAGKLDAAIATYRALITEKPDDEPPVRLLYNVLTAQGRTPEATAVLDAGLAAQPAARSLRWLQAGELEHAGKIEEAIAVYDGLYAEDSSDIVVANNLASLIASYHTEPEMLARAEAISRRLRGIDNPAFQDTYGWIAFLNGNTLGAIAHLEPAAKGLPDDALTQYHLGKLYQSMDRAADAVAQYDRALAIAAKSPALAALPQIKDAQTERDKLKVALEAAKSP